MMNSKTTNQQPGALAQRDDEPEDDLGHPDDLSAIPEEEADDDEFENDDDEDDTEDDDTEEDS